MKKLLLVSFVVCLLAFTAFAQTWEVVKETPGPNRTDDADFVTASTGYILLDGEFVWKTIDGGANWTELTVDAEGTPTLEMMDFVDENTGYIAADDGFIYKTSDGGANWTMVADTAVTKDDLNCLHALDADTVFFGGNDSTFIKTTDGGASFTRSSYSFDGNDIDAVAFTDATHGVVVENGSGGNTWYTEDGGDNWSYVSVSDQLPVGANYDRMYSVVALGTSTFIVTGYHHCKFLSSDGGKTYTHVGPFSYSIVRNYLMEVVDANTIVAGGSDAWAEISTDGGANWTKLSLPTGQNLYGLSFVSADEGYVFGDDKQWFKTTDGGASWVALNEWPAVSFFGLACPSADNIFATAMFGGEVTVSNDGGATWSYPDNLLTGSQNSLLDVEFVSPTKGFIVGYDGEMYKTDDSGANWTLVETDWWTSATNFYGIDALDADTIFAGGYRGLALYTYDGGDNWTEIEVTDKSIYKIAPLSGTQFLYGAQSGVYGLFDITVDSSLWEVDFGSTSTRNMIVRNDTCFMSSGSGIYVTPVFEMQDTLYNVFDTDEEIYDLEFINDHIGYAVCSDGIIAKTEDGGYSWALDTSPTEETLQAMAYFGENIWVVGQSGTILKTTVPNAVDMLDSGIPEVFTLKQNFPNPFNPTTQISFGMPRTSNVRLEIYNILGQKVRTLVSSDLNAGFHVYEWDARNDAGQRMAAGVYIYQLNTGDFAQQKKMLLLK